MLSLLVILVLGSFAIEYAFKKEANLVKLVSAVSAMVIGGWMACSVIRLALVYFNLWPSIERLFR